MVADLERVAIRDRWGTSFMAVGWIHLATHLSCQLLIYNDIKPHVNFVGLWALELVANLYVVRRISGRGWYRSTPLMVVLSRVWATFLILSFNLASLNTLTGWSLDWFKPVWTTLSTFGFATTAYLVNPWYFVPAVQMYFTGLLMVTNPDWQYLIYGISWWTTFQGLGLVLEIRKRRHLESDRVRTEISTPEVEEVLA
ncbi:hypothetical protein ACYOEI_16855 [Singulisphaera rosea]